MARIVLQILGCVHHHDGLKMVHSITRLAKLVNKCKYTSCYWGTACSVICLLLSIVLVHSLVTWIPGSVISNLEVDV